MPASVMQSPPLSTLSLSDTPTVAPTVAPAARVVEVGRVGGGLEEILKVSLFVITSAVEVVVVVVATAPVAAVLLLLVVVLVVGVLRVKYEIIVFFGPCAGLPCLFTNIGGLYVPRSLCV